MSNREHLKSLKSIKKKMKIIYITSDTQITTVDMALFTLLALFSLQRVNLTERMGSCFGWFLLTMTTTALMQAP